MLVEVWWQGKITFLKLPNTFHIAYNSSVGTTTAAAIRVIAMAGCRIVHRQLINRTKRYAIKNSSALWEWVEQRVDSRSIGINYFFLAKRRNVRGQFASPMDWNRANAFRDRVIQKPSHVSCAAKFLAKTISARARSNGTKRLMMFPICLQNPELLAMTTSDIAMCSRSVEKSIRLVH